MRLCLAITSPLLYPSFMNTAHHQLQAARRVQLTTALQLTTAHCPWSSISRRRAGSTARIGPPPRSSRSRSSHRRLARGRPGSARRSGRHLVRGIGVGLGLGLGLGLGSGLLGRGGLVSALAIVTRDDRCKVAA
eukprot:scaffold12264_cov58-Phaeocystis_antarctica.AAC.1